MAASALAIAAIPSDTICKEKCLPATPANIRAIVAGSMMLTYQSAVSAAGVQGYVNLIESGGTPPPINVDGNKIVDGNHRYIAGLLCGKLVSQRPWVAPLTRPAFPLSSIQVY